MIWDSVMPDTLDWTVEKRTIHRVDGSAIRGSMEIIRSDTEEHLGIVGSNYEPLQNLECAEFASTLEGATVEKCGTFGKGCKVWWAIKLPGELYIGGDVLYKYSIMVNAHDGSLGFRWFITPIRPRCSNMMNMLIRSALDFNISTRHTRHIKSRVEEAQRVFYKVNAVYAELQQAYDGLIKAPFDSTNLYQYVRSVLRPADAEHGRYKTALEIIEANYQTEQYSETKWGALNSVTKYFDHQRPMRGEAQNERRLANAIYGTGAQLKQRAYEMLLEGPDGPNYLYYSSHGAKGSIAEDSGEESSD